MEIKLNPCPLCGGEGEFKTRDFDPMDFIFLRDRPDIHNDGVLHFVKCKNCGAESAPGYDNEWTAQCWNESDVGRDD